MSNLGLAIDRIVQMQVDAVSGVAGVPTPDAVGYFPYSQERTPYWMNHVQTFDVVRDSGAGVAEDIELRVYTVQMYLVYAHMDENYWGITQDKLYEVIPAVLDYFGDRPFLTNSVTSDPLDYIWQESGGAQIENGQGIALLQNSGVNERQIASRFTLSLPILHSIY